MISAVRLLMSAYFAGEFGENYQMFQLNPALKDKDPLEMM